MSVMYASSRARFSVARALFFRGFASLGGASSSWASSLRVGLGMASMAIVACSYDPAAFTHTRSFDVSDTDPACGQAAVVSTLPCSTWAVQAPFVDGFDGSAPGLTDAAGKPTGFPIALASAAGQGYNPANLALDEARGELTITTSSGIAQVKNNGQENVLGVNIGLPRGVFRIDGTLVSPPAGSGAYEQAGIWFGISQQNYIKLVLVSAPDALVIQVLLEENDTPRAPLYATVPAPPDRVRLSLEIDPLRREARAFATIDGAAERLVGSISAIPDSWLGLAPAASGQSTPLAFAGISATHRNRASALGPLGYRFADFEVHRRLALPMEPEALGNGWSATPVFPGITFNNPTSLAEAPGTGHLFVSEREGRVFAVPRTGGGPRKSVLDLSGVTQGFQDCGLLGLAFHPQFGDRSSPNRGYMYVHYAHADPPMKPPVALEAPTDSRLSRFTVDLDTLVADPSSEQVLIAQQDENIWHQGGGMFFNPEDGFLYLTVGDEGGSLCVYDNCQRIDKDLFSGVLRIDVDRRGGDISHPISRQPQSGATANYFIPNDNPFVGQGGLEEFYALGLRSPHRMTFDPVDRIAWIGDVGQNHLEELDVLRPAANYQWAFREGSIDRGLEMTQTPLGVWTDPVLELPRDESNAIIGGYVYRGSRFPELNGKYIFGDYVYGSIWALDYANDGATTQVLGRERLLSGLLGRSGTIASFGVDGDGELYVLTVGAKASLLRLDRSDPRSTLPPLLSQIGAFEDLAELTPSADLIGYEVQSPLWSDGANKQRWIIPPDAAASPAAAPPGKIAFAASGPYTFPEGTVFVKHFELALDEREPERRQRLETRFLVAGHGGYYGVSYKWNTEGTDAEPVLDSQIEELDITEADGTVRHQPYFYPSPSDCLVCHNAEAGAVLGVRTAQLNGPLLDPVTGTEENQLLTWSERGLLDTAIAPATLDALPRLANIEDATRSVEDRVRSYLDSNCSMCHGVLPDIRAHWDARYQTPLPDQGLINGPLQGEAELPPDALVITPNDPQLSAIYLRDGSDDPDLRMPPIGRQTTDQRYLNLLQTWIQSLPAP
jgi:glucose/arabinose dehydrogenase